MHRPHGSAWRALTGLGDGCCQPACSPHAGFPTPSHSPPPTARSARSPASSPGLQGPELSPANGPGRLHLPRWHLRSPGVSSRWWSGAAGISRAGPEISHHPRPLAATVRTEFRRGCPTSQMLVANNALSALVSGHSRRHRPPPHAQGASLNWSGCESFSCHNKSPQM